MSTISRGDFSPQLHSFCDTIIKLLVLSLCAVKKRMYAKIEPHRARSITYAILRNYKKKTAELKKLAIKYKNLIKYKSSLIQKLYEAFTLFPKGKSID